MKRRDFIISIISSGAFLATSASGAYGLESSNTLPSDTLKKIAGEFPESGRIFQALTSTHMHDHESLYDLISSLTSEHDIRKRIRLDYKNGRCFILSGWLISQTEAACIISAGPL